MDSTLIDTEVIDELARVAGVGSEVEDHIGSDGWRDRLFGKFETAVALLAGLDESYLERIAARLP